VVPEIEPSLAIGGKVVLLGVGAQPVPTRPAAYRSRGAGIHAMMGHLGGFDPVIELHAAGRLDLRPIITARYALADGIEAMRRAGRRQEAKILLLPPGAEA
jgi:threonine dehydrogenase-like Zn-dependent dehydrogenase